MRIPLRPGDRIIAATHHYREDMTLVFTEYGDVFQVVTDPITGITICKA